jgi:hypothetical protein
MEVCILTAVEEQRSAEADAVKHVPSQGYHWWAVSVQPVASRIEESRHTWIKPPAALCVVRNFSEVHRKVVGARRHIDRRNDDRKTTEGERVRG